MHTESVVYTHSGILLSREKAGHPAMCDNMGGPGGVTLSELGRRRANAIGYHIGCMHSMNLKPIETGNGVVDARGPEVGDQAQ